MQTLIFLLSTVTFVTASTDVPIIGILSQEAFKIQPLFPEEEIHSYIAASYVKILENAGARVVPIMIGENVSYYENIVKNTNGVLLPGGGAFFNESNGYADAGQILYDLALDINIKGDYYPVISLCLGMELLAHIAGGGKELRTFCVAQKQAHPLDFKTGYRSSKILSSASEEIIKILKTENVTYNNHQLCVTEQNFTLFGLEKDWDIVSTNKDVNGLEFISILESKLHPFYGLQFHPEKPIYEFKESLNIPHTKDAVEVGQYFANFFVGESRKNNHSFENQKEEVDSLIYNYEAHYIGREGSDFEQVYTFKKNEYLRKKKYMPRYWTYT